jgi:molybdopterin-guanine dinucleotide biosynthesis protein A
LNQAQRGIRLLSRVCQKTILSLRDGQTIPGGCGDIETVLDIQGVGGPLAGILAAFECEPKAAWFVMACDLPFVGGDLVEGLLAARDGGFDFLAYASAADGLPEPLCAIYEPSSLAILRNHAERGCFSPRQILAAGRTRLLVLPRANRGALENFNTPGDLEGVPFDFAIAHP